jgi:hypothetical protein
MKRNYRPRMTAREHSIFGALFKRIEAIARCLVGAKKKTPTRRAAGRGVAWTAQLRSVASRDRKTANNGGL